MSPKPLVLATLFLAGCASRAAAPVAPSPAATGQPAGVEAGRVATVHWPDGKVKERVRLELYLMSKCRYAAAAVLAAKELVDAVGDPVEVRVDYIATAEPTGRLSSLHGDPEVEGDILQLCVQKLYPSARTFLAFMACQSRSYATIPQGWEQCADEAGVSRYRVRSCQRSEGERLLRASLARAQAANATGSPTILIAGSPHQGERTLTGFLRPLCKAFRSAPPAPCKALPEEVEVRATVLSDRRCPACATETIMKNLEARFFPKLSVKLLDYGSAEGKRLYRELKLRVLPAILFDASVEKAEGYSLLGRWLVDVGSYKQLRIPASFDPTAELCDNGIDDNADGKVDCADRTCLDTLVCRKELKRRLDVFVMSQCPFAAQGIVAMKEVLKTFQGKLAFDLHYIVEKGDGGFTALHGPAEVEENRRQLCAKKLYRRGNLYLDYLTCRAADYRSEDWERCATGKLSARRIAACVKKEGDALLGLDHKLTTALRMSASPTWLANNRHTFTGITAAAIIEGVCKHNPELAACKNRVPASQPATGASPGSCGS
jgi:hypothetical protein